jgi:ABC-type Na+ efflux pump permease subunit
MLDSLCRWPFLSWTLLAGFALWMVARSRLRREREHLTAGTVPDHYRVDSKRAVQGELEDTVHHELRFTDSEGNAQSVRVSRSVYRATRAGDQVTVYRHPRSTQYVHPSEALSFSTPLTSILWALAWILVFVGGVDLVVYLVIGESPWCLVIGEHLPWGA